MRDISNLPKFKYHPNLYESDAVTWLNGVCECCGKEIEVYVESMYAEESVDCICLDCVANGKAAEKFDGEFIQAAQPVSDPAKEEELFKRTPGYNSWQGECWLACCDDYCAFLETVGTKELEEMGIADEVFAEYDGSLEDIRDYLVKDGSVNGYLFQCLHCGKYHLHVDMN